MRAATHLGVAVTLIVFCCTHVRAQRTSATLSGVVFDQLDQVVPGVTVRTRNLETGQMRQVSTNDRGQYRLAGLSPGLYEVRVSMEGLRTVETSRIELAVAEESVLDLTLDMGQLDHEIIVVAAQMEPDSGNMAVGEVVPQIYLEELPLNGRDLTQLGLLLPGIAWSRGSTRDINVGFGKKVSVAGARPSQNLFTIDGTDANDALNHTPAGATGQLTGVETVQEFRVASNSMSAEFGRAAGGVFNLITKSGSKDLFGSLFWFHRNDNLDARQFFDARKPEFRRNQFGFSLGGALRGEETFYFVSYEGLRELRGVSQQGFVPDAVIREARPGDEIYFKAIDESAVLSPTVVSFLELYPHATGSEVVPGTHVADFLGVLDRRAHEDFFNARMDHELSEQDSLMARYLLSNSEQVIPVLFPDFPNLATNERHLFTFSETHSRSSGLVNEFLFGFNRSTPSETVPTPPDEKNLSLIEGRNLGSLRVTAGDGLPGLTEVGTDRTNPKSFRNRTFQVSDNLFLNFGKHFLKLGFLFERFHFDGVSESRSRGRLEFRSLLDLLDDHPRRIEGASARSDFERNYRQSLFGLYLQDDFRVHSRLTLFAGLRWEFVTTPRELDGKVSNVTDYLDPEATIVVANPGFADPENRVNCCRPLFDNPSLSNVAPRLGLAWDFLGNRKTILRAGFGLFHEPMLYHLYRNPVFRTLPFVERNRIPADSWPGGDTLAALPLPATIFASPEGAQSTEAFQYEVKNPYTIHYNLNLQQQFSRRILLSMAYVGSRGVQLFGRGDTNLAPRKILADGRIFFPDDERANSNFDSIGTTFQGFNSWYHSLQLSLQRRFEGSLGWHASYTFSRCLDERSGTGGRQNHRFGQARTFDPFERSLDKGLCDFHLQHNLVLNHLYRLPLGERLDGWGGRLLRGWRINGILSAASGTPFTVSIEGDPDGDGSDDNSARPDLVGDPRSGSCPGGTPVGTPDCWFNPAAFAFPGQGFRGNLGRNTLTGPGLLSYDFSLSKRGRLSEGVELEFRFETFNLLNRANLNPPANTEEGPQLFSEEGTLDLTAVLINARSGTSTGPRELQLGVRLIF